MFAASPRWFAAVALAALLAFGIGIPALEAQVPVRLTGGFGADPSQPREQPWLTLHVTPEVTGPLAKTWAKLQKPVKMAFPAETPLHDVLTYIQRATQEKGDKGIQIHEERVGFMEDAVPSGEIDGIQLEGVPLATALSSVLKPLGMMYYVHEDGLVVIAQESMNRPVEPESQILKGLDSLRKEVAALHEEMLRGRAQPPARPTQDPAHMTSPVGKTTSKPDAHRERNDPRPDGAERSANSVKMARLAVPLSGKAAETWMRLRQPLAMAFETETPPVDVISYIKTKTKSESSGEIQFYFDRIGIQRAEKIITSPVVLSVEGIPLATSLKLMLKPIGLAFYVHHDGMVVITAEGDANPTGVDDHSGMVLDQISMLRNEVAAMRELKAASEAATLEK